MPFNNITANYDNCMLPRYDICSISCCRHERLLKIDLPFE